MGIPKYEPNPVTREVLTDEIVDRALEWCEWPSISRDVARG